jgi:hypothetical protein
VLVEGRSTSAQIFIAPTLAEVASLPTLIMARHVRSEIFKLSCLTGTIGGPVLPEGFSNYQNQTLFAPPQLKRCLPSAT